MKNKAQYKSNAKEFLRDDGFVLPYVILVIAILSISVILLGERLQNVTGNTAVIENEFNAELALLNAESEATYACLLYTSPSPRDGLLSRMPSSA